MLHSDSPPPLDPKFQAAVERLYRLTLLTRWAVVILLWMTVGVFSLWQLSYPFSLLQQYFTWAAVRHGMINHFWATIGLATCLTMTISVVAGQLRTRWFGRSRVDQERLEKMVLKVRQQGKLHPLWRWLE